MRPEQSNPVRLIKRYKETERDRFLSAGELEALGRTHEEAEQQGLPWQIKAKGSAARHLAKDADTRRSAVNPTALAAVRLQNKLVSGSQLG